MSSIYSIGEAKTHLSKLVRQVEEGEEVVLRRGSQPVVRLVAITDQDATIKRRPGRMRGRLVVPDDFDEWPEDIAKALCIID
jgi:prevent-host-death family protein